MTDRPCGDLTIDPATFNPADAIDGKHIQGSAKLRIGRITLSDQPAGAKVATLEVSQDDPLDVIVLDRQASFARIAWDIDSLVIFGWVRATDLGSGLMTIGAFSGLLSGTGELGFGTSRHATRVVICTRELPLIADLHGERRTVGAILTGTRIDLMAKKERHWEVLVRSSSVRPAPNADLLVRAQDLASCQDVVGP